MTEPNTTLPLRQRIAKAIADDGRAQADAYDPSVQYVSLDFRAGYAAATARAVEVVSEVDDGLLAADAAELALFRERDALTRKALKAESDGPLQFLALHVRQQRDRATAERDEARARLRGMARRASMLRRSREKWRRLAGKQTHERVHDMAASMASNGQLRAENRRVKAERDEALVALAKQQAVLAEAVVIPEDARTEIRNAIANPAGQKLAREQLGDQRESVASWGARAVLKLMETWRVAAPRVEKVGPVVEAGAVSASSACGAQEGMTGIRCDLAPGHQDQHSGRHTTTHGPDNVTVNIQWDRASWDTCAPANPVWVAGNREPGGDVVQAVQGRMTGRIYRRETEHFGGAWFWGTERGQWVVWERLLESERLAEAVEVSALPEGSQR